MGLCWVWRQVNTRVGNTFVASKTTTVNMSVLFSFFKAILFPHLLVLFVCSRAPGTGAFSTTGTNRGKNALERLETVFGYF